MLEFPEGVKHEQNLRTWQVLKQFLNNSGYIYHQYTVWYCKSQALFPLGIPVISIANNFWQHLDWWKAFAFKNKRSSRKSAWKAGTLPTEFSNMLFHSFTPSCYAKKMILCHLNIIASHKSTALLPCCNFINQRMGVHVAFYVLMLYL